MACAKEILQARLNKLDSVQQVMHLSSSELQVVLWFQITRNSIFSLSLFLLFFRESYCCSYILV